MTTAVTALGSRPAAPAWTRRPKIDQWICWWTIPVFYNIFGLIFVVLTRVMPPPRPDVGPDQIVAFFTEHSLSIRIGFGLLMIFIGITGFANGLIAFQIKSVTSWKCGVRRRGCVS